MEAYQRKNKPFPTERCINQKKNTLLNSFIDNRTQSIKQAQLKKIIQRQVEPALDPYDPKSNRTIMDSFNELDQKLPEAIQEAEEDLQNEDMDHTPHQEYYIATKTPRAWGYCIEEKLNKKAIDLEWETQSILSNSRPDYFKSIDNINVFADLTTSTQSNGGSHIWEKLIRSKQDNAMAADITYSSRGPNIDYEYIPNLNKVANHLLRLLKDQEYTYTDDTDEVIYFLTAKQNLDYIIPRAYEILSN